MDGPVMRMVVLEAIGKAVNKSVSIAETLRRKIPLHQITHLTICEIVEVYAPIEEGLDLVEAKRFISCMFITLSLDPLDTTDIGYQPPISYYGQIFIDANCTYQNTLPLILNSCNELVIRNNSILEIKE